MKTMDLIKSIINALKTLFATKVELKNYQKEITDEVILESMVETKFIRPIASNDNKLYVSKSGKVYIF